MDGPTNLELYLSVNSESLHAEEEDEWNENFDEIHDFFNKIVKNEKCAMMENGRLSGHPAPYAIVWVDTNAINLEHLEKVAPENDWFKQSKFQLLFLPGGPEYM